MPKLHLQGRHLLLEAMPLQHLEKRTILTKKTDPAKEKRGKDAGDIATCHRFKSYQQRHASILSSLPENGRI
jgi:hypothetical protein